MWRRRADRKLCYSRRWSQPSVYRASFVVRVRRVDPEQLESKACDLLSVGGGNRSGEQHAHLAEWTRAADSGSGGFSGFGGLELLSGVDRPAGDRRQTALATDTAGVESTHTGAAATAVVTPAEHTVTPASMTSHAWGRRVDRRLRWSAGATTSRRRRRDVQSERAEARYALSPKDDVVEDRDTEQEPSLSGVTRQLHILSRRRRIRRHVIVDQDDRGSVGADGVAEAIGQADPGLGLAALVDEWRVDQPAATIEQHDAQLLLGQVDHLGTQIGCNVSRFAK